MSDISQFCQYLDVVRNLNYTTTARHASYMISYKLFLLENWLEHCYSSIQARKNDLRYYVSDNTVYKYIGSIKTYSKYRAIYHNDYTVRPDRIDNVKYEAYTGYNIPYNTR